MTCALNHGLIRRCLVVAYVRHRRVGAGVGDFGGSSRRRLRVPIRLNSLGRSLVRAGETPASRQVDRVRELARR